MMDHDSMQTRFTLLEKIKNRYDESAWEEFIFYYKRYIFNVLLRMRMSESEAEELCQNIIVKLWKKLPEFKYEKKVGKFRTWLYAVITNEVRSKIKSSKVQRKYFSCEEEIENSGMGDASCDPEIVRIADDEWALYVSNLAWSNLQKKMPEKYTTIFQMFLDGKSSEEIAEQCSMLLNTVYVYKKRAKDQLAAEIKYLTQELL